MKKRIRLSDRKLPCYSKGEEITNMVTHIVGGAFGILALAACIQKALPAGSIIVMAAAVIYAVMMICLYAMSSIYHGLCPGTGKKVMQILDHCTIYWFIAGTYTPILICAILPRSAAIAIFLLVLQWGLAIVATVLTAIDLKKYKIFSMCCYIAMGWSIAFFFPLAYEALGRAGFFLLLYGGISYTIGAILFGIGAKIAWFHSLFHLFVILGSLLHFLCIYFYVL